MNKILGVRKSFCCRNTEGDYLTLVKLITWAMWQPLNDATLYSDDSGSHILSFFTTPKWPRLINLQVHLWIYLSQIQNESRRSKFWETLDSPFPVRGLRPFLGHIWIRPILIWSPKMASAETGVSPYYI